MFAVDGTPTDCVNIAVTQVYKGLPDLVVSGINKGWNLGDDVTYSGTVAGALEAALLGVQGHCRLASSDAWGVRLGPSALAASTHGRCVAAQSAAVSDVSQHQCAGRNAEGLSRHGPSHTQPRHVRCRAARSQRTSVLLDRGRSGRLGTARPFRLPGGARWIRLADAPQSRSHGSRMRSRRWRNWLLVRWMAHSGEQVIEELQEVVTSDTMTRLPKYPGIKPVGAWLSLVEHLVRDRGVGGSNPLAPTINPKNVRKFVCSWRRR